jgi:hypothetical protein
MLVPRRLHPQVQHSPSSAEPSPTSPQRQTIAESEESVFNFNNVNSICMKSFSRKDQIAVDMADFEEEDNPFADAGDADDYNPFDDSMFDKKVATITSTAAVA